MNTPLHLTDKDLHDPSALVARVSKRLRDANKRLALAESCTGGLLSSWLTDLPGASTFFQGGVVSYSDLAKQRLLGVRAETLERWGAVSEACAREMVEGARERFDADVAVAITGVRALPAERLTPAVRVVRLKRMKRRRSTMTPSPRPGPPGSRSPWPGP